MQMWGEDSEIIYTYLKSNELTKAIPIVLFSTLNRSAQNTIAHCADGFISIPFEINDLPSLLEKLTS
jgi:two-component system alkaline phosphatase synthesis response regulator PhoP